MPSKNVSEKQYCFLETIILWVGYPVKIVSWKLSFLVGICYSNEN